MEARALPPSVLSLRARSGHHEEETLGGCQGSLQVEASSRRGRRRRGAHAGRDTRSARPVNSHCPFRHRCNSRSTQGTPVVVAHECQRHLPRLTAQECQRLFPRAPPQLPHLCAMALLLAAWCATSVATPAPKCAASVDPSVDVRDDRIHSKTLVGTLG